MVLAFYIASADVFRFIVGSEYPKDNHAKQTTPALYMVLEDTDRDF